MTDVKELVRYSLVNPDPYRRIMSKALNGEYVTYSQAVAVIESLNKNIDELKGIIDDAYAKIENQKTEFNEYLHRSDSAKTIAAKEAECAGYREYAAEKSNQVIALQKRAGAAEAELATLKEINANLMGDDEDKPRYTTKRLKHEIEKAVEAREALKEARNDNKIRKT